MSVPHFVDSLLWYILPGVAKQTTLCIGCYRNPGSCARIDRTNLDPKELELVSSLLTR
jgi:hypothetical protein